MRSSLTYLGVPVRLRPAALLAGVLNALIVGLVTRDRRMALAAALLWYVADGGHVAGHIVSSQVVAAPLTAIDFGLYPKNVYHNDQVSPQQHIGRASGGVLASLLATLVWALLARAAAPGTIKTLLTIAAIQHGLLGGASLLPIPFVDGGVIYANLAKIMA